MLKLKTLFSVITLLISATCAQAQFDTVINLPEDLANPNPAGFSGDGIGDVRFVVKTADGLL